MQFCQISPYKYSAIIWVLYTPDVQQSNRQSNNHISQCSLMAVMLSSSMVLSSLHSFDGCLNPHSVWQEAVGYWTLIHTHSETHQHTMHRSSSHIILRCYQPCWFTSTLVFDPLLCLAYRSSCTCLTPVFAL